MQLTGMAMRQCNSARLLRSCDSHSERLGWASRFLIDIRDDRHLHRNGVLGEVHDAEFGASRLPFITLAVIERDGVSHAVRRDRVTRALRQGDLDHRAAIALDEHVAQRAVLVHVLRVDHGIAAAEGAEFPGGDRRELPRAQGGIAQAQGARIASGASPSVSQARTAVTSSRKQRDRQ